MSIILRKEVFVGLLAAVLMLTFMATPARAQGSDTATLMALIEQLRARVTALQAQLPSQSATSFSAGSTSSESNTTAVVGDEVTTTSNLRVRAFYSTNSVILTTVRTGTSGTVLNAATDENGLRWLQVDYETGVRGWSASPWLQKTGSGDGSPVDDNDVAKATCEQLEFQPSTVSRGENTTLVWKTENATRAVAEVESGDEKLEALANESFPLRGSQEYTVFFSAEVDLTVYGENYSSRDECSTTLTVLDDDDEPINSATEEEVADAVSDVVSAPASCEISMNPSTVTRGDTVTMEWSSENAKRIVHSVTAEKDGEEYNISALVNDEFPLNGEYEFRPLHSSVTKLNVYGENGLNVASCEAELTVNPIR